MSKKISSRKKLSDSDRAAAIDNAHEISSQALRAVKESLENLKTYKLAIEKNLTHLEKYKK